MLYISTFVLALCSIVYELLLGQTLSAFLGNTILRYSVTIGLYMSSMGFGALFLPRRFSEKPILGLLKVEFALSLIGSLSVFFLLAIYSLGAEGLLFSACAHGLIILIGLLTGFELPLLVIIGNSQREDSESRVLGVDYLGAFAGTLLFAFLFYPRLGIIASAICVGALNALVGFGISLRNKDAIPEEEAGSFRLFLFLTMLVLLALFAALFYVEQIESFGVSLYLYR